jgi:hypothetical protein
VLIKACRSPQLDERGVVDVGETVLEGRSRSKCAATAARGSVSITSLTRPSSWDPNAT